MHGKQQTNMQDIKATAITQAKVGIKPTHKNDRKFIKLISNVQKHSLGNGLKNITMPYNVKVIDATAL